MTRLLTKNGCFRAAATKKFDDTLGQTATYQKIRQDYAEDLKVIAETGKAPENTAVSAALQK